MQKLYQSFESEAQNIQKLISNYQEKLQGKFQGMIEKSEAKKQKLLEKMQTTKEQLQISIDRNNPSKIFKLQNKIEKLEAEMSKVNRKDQIANDFHLVYDGLFNQLQITQNQNIEKLTQAQRDDNYQILCSIKRQAINLSNQVYKKKHLEPIRQICHHCNTLLNQYLKFGVDKKIQQPDIFAIDIEQDKQFVEKKKFEEERIFQKQERQQQYQDQKAQSRVDKKNKKQRQESNLYLEKEQKRNLKQQEQYENKKQYNYNKSNYKKYQEEPYDIKQNSEVNVIKQFDNVKIEDQKQNNQNVIQQVQNKQETVTNLDDSNLCQICFEFPKQYVATPCGHFVYCQNCKDLAVKECLICREPVQLLIKVFQ
ncbi:unnamed protein product (macronuclear) [Paramecium tetraurelia]|uniref:RING-type domain-containing protein n=1 Tax=Paramecium tetraurelia TaxID=5888 RepID=A0EE53_PARTE|nr:uncharacterized protein GSPATT00025914001 [Paramecium tetraurelia]CAK93570.1 unnamed protein product [Paramecium tetraurelia]|eukprot:XP_001460967.1 hypothetical protein (macronuclear) [Paramecium tetraurelia strain d4-2]